MSNRVPKVISIRILRARGLQIDEDKIKKKKVSHQWKVICIAAGKKQVTQTIEDFFGNPTFNCDVKIKLPRKEALQPLILLVVNSHEVHVGQVIISPETLPGVPMNANLLSPEEIQNKMFNVQNLQCQELEQTKKNANPHGYLYFWCYVEEYAEAQSKNIILTLGNGGGSSSLSQSNLHRSSTSIFSGSKQNLKSLFHRGSKKSMKSNNNNEFQQDPLEPNPRSATLSNQFYGNSNYAKSMQNISYQQQQSPTHQQRERDDSRSLSPSESSVIMHSDYREQADGRGDSEASSLHNNTLPLVREIPPSPSSTGREFSLYASDSQSKTRDYHESYGNSLSGSRLSSLNNSFSAVHATTTTKSIEFQSFPEQGELREEFTVTLYGNQLRQWIKENAIAVRVHDRYMSLADCIDFSGRVDNPEHQVTLRMPAMSQPVQCHIQLDTAHMGSFRSGNLFVYGNPSAAAAAGFGGGGGGGSIGIGRGNSFSTSAAGGGGATHITHSPPSPPPVIITKTRRESLRESENYVSSYPVINKAKAPQPPQPAMATPAVDVRRSASFSPQPPPTKPKVPLSSVSQHQQLRPTLRSIGGSLLNLAMGGSSATSSKNSSTRNLSSSPSNGGGNNNHHHSNNNTLTVDKRSTLTHERNQSDSMCLNASANASGLLRNESLEAARNKKTKSLSKKELVEMNNTLQHENSDLVQRLTSVNQKIAQLNDENITLKSQLSSRNREIDDLSSNLCNLRLQLLDDGMTKYLELK